MTPAISLLTAFLGLAAALPVADAPRAESRATGCLMAVPVDDLPVAQPSWHSDAQMDRISSELVSTLTRHGVPAVGFVNEGRDPSIFAGEPEPPAWVAEIGH